MTLWCGNPPPLTSSPERLAAMNLIVVSGISGSGKSIALNTLEDQGYYCIDNLPTHLLGAFVDGLLECEDSAQDRIEKAAVGIDVRNRHDQLCQLPEQIHQLRKRVDCELFFLHADDSVLLKRFSETRRRHPLSTDQIPLADALRRERELLEPIATDADLVLDTTHTNLYQLRDLIAERLGSRNAHKTSVLIQSFGFKHGVPADADFLFDVRCLPNPHWQPQLRPHTGKDPEVITWLESQPGVNDMQQDILRFARRWIPEFVADNRAYLCIAIGCTGGQHRSVYIVEQLASMLQGAFSDNPDGASMEGASITLRHRELNP